MFFDNTNAKQLCTADVRLEHKENRGNNGIYNSILQFRDGDIPGDLE